MIRMNLHAIPKPHESVHVKIQLYRPGRLDTLGRVHMPRSMFPDLLRALKSVFDVTTTGALSHGVRSS